MQMIKDMVTVARTKYFNTIADTNAGEFFLILILLIPWPRGYLGFDLEFEFEFEFGWLFLVGWIIVILYFMDLFYCVSSTHDSRLTAEYLSTSNVLLG